MDRVMQRAGPMMRGSKWRTEQDLRQTVSGLLKAEKKIEKGEEERNEKRYKAISEKKHCWFSGGLDGFWKQHIGVF